MKDCNRKAFMSDSGVLINKKPNVEFRLACISLKEWDAA